MGMKLSIWNIYHRLSYPDKISLIKDGKPTIQGVRWIVSKDLNPDTVYVGDGEEFFHSDGGNTIVVHRNDMILVQNAEPEEVFNEVSSILDLYHTWGDDLEGCMDKPNGLAKMLAVSAKILGNPAFIYAPDGKALAISPGYPPSIHWHWAEILEHHGLTEDRIKYLQKVIDLTNIFQDRQPVIRDFGIDEPQYLHCSLVADGFMVGHFVLFSMIHPFEHGIEHLASILIQYFLRYIRSHREIYHPDSRVHMAVSALIHDRYCKPEDFQFLLQSLNWNPDTDIYQVYIWKELVAGEPVLLLRTCQILSAIVQGSVVFQEGNFLVLLLNQSRTCGDCSVHLPKGLDERFRCGISAPFRGIRQVNYYYQQALMELVRCKEKHLTRAFALDHVTDHLQSLLRQDPLNQTYVFPELRTLIEYDQSEKTHLYETLRAWLYCGFHPSAAASMLGIHRNTFNYRLEKMKDMIPQSPIFNLSASRDRNQINEYLYSFLYLDAEGNSV